MSDPYTRVSRRELYRNPWLTVEVHEIVHPSGVPGEHVLVGGGAASGVLVVEDGGFIFARQPRFGAREWVVEIVKGGADAGETALDCAKRELREELGLTASSWTPIGATFELPSIMDAPVQLFVAAGLQRVATELEHVETIDPLRMSIEDAYAAALDGRIDDAVTLAAMLRYRLITGAASSSDSTDTRAHQARH